jgi:hypothetical protein
VLLEFGDSHRVVHGGLPVAPSADVFLDLHPSPLDLMNLSAQISHVHAKLQP